MRIRDANSINLALELDPLPNGFVSIPIYTHMEHTMLDDIAMEGCSYINAVDGYNFPADSTYASVEYLRTNLRSPIS